MSKILKSIFFLSLFQFLISACICSCPDEPIMLERIHNGLNVKLLDASGNAVTSIVGEVDKKSFGLAISLQFDLKQIGLYEQKIKNLDFGSFGFSAAYACSCPELTTEIIPLDPIKSIIITVRNVQNQEASIITNNFVANGALINGSRIDDLVNHINGIKIPSLNLS